MSPWTFNDQAKESQFREYFFQSFLTRYCSLLRWNLVGVYVINVTASLLTVVFDEGDVSQYFGLLLRWAGTITSTLMYCIKWSDGNKPIVAKSYMWLTRISFFLVGVIEAGLKQPDSKLKVALLWATYVAGVFLPTYEEYLSYSIVVTYMELCRLVVFGGPCPVDSARECTSYELWEHFAHHTLYLGIAAWIQYHANSDRRRDYAKRTRKEANDILRAQRPKSSETRTLGLGKVRPPSHAMPAQARHTVYRRALSAPSGTGRRRRNWSCGGAGRRVLLRGTRRRRWGCFALRCVLGCGVWIAHGSVCVTGL